MQHDDMKVLSSFLVGKLKQHISTYQEYASAPNRERWTLVQQKLAEFHIFLTAELDPPYHCTPQHLVSLKGSEEHVNYRLVCNAVPVTDTSHGNTASLRTILALPTEPQLQHVVDLLKTAQPCQGQLNLPQALMRSGAAAALSLILQDIQQAYQHICSGIATLLADGAADLTAVSAQLASQPWVMLPGNHFVKPSQLVFIQPGGANAGKIGLHPDLDWLAEDDHHVDTFQLTMSRVHAWQVRFFPSTGLVPFRVYVCHSSVCANAASSRRMHLVSTYMHVMLHSVR